MYLDLLQKMNRKSYQSGNAEDRCKPNKQIRFETPMLQSDLCDYGDAHIVVKGTVTATDPDNNAYDKKLTLQIMQHSPAAF